MTKNTSLSSFQKKVETNLIERDYNSLMPMNNHKAIVFIDDLHLADT